MSRSFSQAIIKFINYKTYTYQQENKKYGLKNTALCKLIPAVIGRKKTFLKNCERATGNNNVLWHNLGTFHVLNK